jgi:hypothetical protein
MSVTTMTGAASREAVTSTTNQVGGARNVIKRRTFP